MPGQKKGMTSEAAIEAYIDLANRLLKKIRSGNKRQAYGYRGTQAVGAIHVHAPPVGIDDPFADK